MLTELSIWVLAPLIFTLRIVDVSLGTMRTVAVVRGNTSVSVMMGLAEVLVWITATSSVIANLDSSIWLMLAYSFGYAAGNGVGIILERKLSRGRVVARFITESATDAIEEFLEKHTEWTARWAGHGGPDMVFTACPRRKISELVHHVTQIDPDVVYLVEPVVVPKPSVPLDRYDRIGSVTNFLRLRK
jgi:uncharacterized protein YebE (UPF0316 family)